LGRQGRSISDLKKKKKNAKITTAHNAGLLAKLAVGFPSRGANEKHVAEMLEMAEVDKESAGRKIVSSHLRKR
jgi:hypothetical protein